ncbi:MAG: hypothetical protein KA368_23530, partial [Acidobacteria bacterium]|nr:hypothetical protein [Acidobacteriota bacterium]
AQPESAELALSKKGLAHAATCQSCAHRLANFRSLVGGLKALAATNESHSASFQTEELLLAAFRQQKVLTVAPPKVNVLASLVRKGWQNPFPLWAYATATAVLVVIGGLAASSWQKGSSPKILATNPSPTPQSLIKQQDTAPSVLVIQPPIKGGKTRLRINKLQKPEDDGSQVYTSLSEFTPIYDEEIATDFLSLTHGVDSQPMESGQLVRVEMPRTALASFGLPVNIERADEPIKADLLLAEDGSARAIRFIR